MSITIKTPNTLTREIVGYMNKQEPVLWLKNKMDKTTFACFRTSNGVTELFDTLESYGSEKVIFPSDCWNPVYSDEEIHILLQ